MKHDDLDALCAFVGAHTNRGDCQCGRCIDGRGSVYAPTGHTVDVTFFVVGMRGTPDASRFRQLVRDLMPASEVSYLELGGKLGDQQFALRTMALGHLLGVWKLLGPEQMLPGLSRELKMQMAGQGYITIAPL